jgi:phenylpyruvate tautomerase PptA (4-oxalocrotonate tautomerase family)
MPIVRIDVQAGKSTVYKRDILRSVREAIISSLGVPEDRVMQRVVETPAENIDSPDTRTDHLTIIEISMLPGRDARLKQALYADIVARLGERPGIHQHDITVLINDPSAECFAIGGVMQCAMPPAVIEPEPELELEPDSAEAEA